jgi:hypothetical protein
MLSSPTRRESAHHDAPSTSPQVCHALVANAARKLKISILFANRTVEDILCKDLLDELAKDPRVTVIAP